MEMALLEFSHCSKTVVLPFAPISLDKLKEYADSVLGYEGHFYFTYNGKRIGTSDLITGGVIRAVPRVVGGKGGFGSMLRAIGAQIEKTTNREACRDLSGRRLRDINEEKRLKNWIAQQADREREASEKRKKKLERLCAEPKHEFQDTEYERQRSDLTEKVWSAVDQGIKASSSGCSASSSSVKRKREAPKVKAKKSCLWVAEFDDLSSCSSDDSEGGCPEGSSANKSNESDRVNERKASLKGESDSSETSVGSSVSSEAEQAQGCKQEVRGNCFGIEDLENEAKESEGGTCKALNPSVIKSVEPVKVEGNATG